jgi:hypothetical protein
MGTTTLLPLWKKCYGFLSLLKINRSRPGLNPRTSGPMASTITTIPPRTTPKPEIHVPSLGRELKVSHSYRRSYSIVIQSVQRNSELTLLWNNLFQQLWPRLIWRYRSLGSIQNGKMLLFMWQPCCVKFMESNYRSNDTARLLIVTFLHGTRDKLTFCFPELCSAQLTGLTSFYRRPWVSAALFNWSNPRAVPGVCVPVSDSCVPDTSILARWHYETCVFSTCHFHTSRFFHACFGHMRPLSGSLCALL